MYYFFFRKEITIANWPIKSEDEVNKFQTCDFFVHPNYDSKFYKNDIALIQICPVDMKGKLINSG